MAGSALFLMSATTVAQTVEGELPNFWDGLNSRALKKEMERPENFPAYLYRTETSTRYKVGRFLIDAKHPTGEMRCEHLKFHHKRSDEVLKWEARHTGASNVFYHVHRAIDYFNALSVLVGEQIYQEKRPVGIRLDMDVDWAMWIKFSELPRYNTSQTLPDADPDKWGTDEEEREIWFFVPKQKYLPRYAPTTWIPGLKDTVLGTAGFPLDSARVPTIIYHEWVHLMTRPYLGITKNTVLNEGYSDYYGSVIGGRPRMGDAQDFSTFPYDRRFDKAPGPAKVKDHKEPGEFVPRLFWSLRNRFGAKRTDALLWNALKHLTPESKLADLPQAIEKAATESFWAPTEMDELKQRLDYLFSRGRYKGRKGS